MLSIRRYVFSPKEMCATLEDMRVSQEDICVFLKEIHVFILELCVSLEESARPY